MSGVNICNQFTLIIINNSRKGASMPEKIDFKKALKQLYNPSTRGFHLVDVPAMSFLMVDGQGDPNTSLEYQQAVEALYSLSYGIKFAFKSHGYDHIIPPLEGLWWMEDMREFTLSNKPRWQWTMMIMQPDWVLPESLDKVREETSRKKPNEMLGRVKFEKFAEGLAVQVFYTGAYKDEALVIASMREFIASHAYSPNGKHHEIYLGDPRKTAPERLHTILRQPVIKS